MSSALSYLIVQGGFHCPVSGADVHPILKTGNKHAAGDVPATSSPTAPALQNDKQEKMHRICGNKDLHLCQRIDEEQINGEATSANGAVPDLLQKIDDLLEGHLASVKQDIKSTIRSVIAVLHHPAPMEEQKLAPTSCQQTQHPTSGSHLIPKVDHQQIVGDTLPRSSNNTYELESGKQSEVMKESLNPPPMPTKGVKPILKQAITQPLSGTEPTEGLIPKGMKRESALGKPSGGESPRSMKRELRAGKPSGLTGAKAGTTKVLHALTGLPPKSFAQQTHTE